MMDRFPILRSLDPWHARIGYLGALASVATRNLDTAEALGARFQELLLDRIYPDDHRYAKLLARVPEHRRVELEKRKMRPEQEDPSATFTEPPPADGNAAPADWLLGTSSKRPKPRLVKTEWLYVSEFWLYDEVMPSALGHVSREKTDKRTLNLARTTGVLLPTLELSDLGYLLKHFLKEAREKDGGDASMFNLLNPRAHECLPPLYFRIMLSNEILYPFLLAELVERATRGERLSTSGKDGLLLFAVTRLVDTIGEITDPEDAPAVREVEKFRDVIAKSESTQENYLRPRLEILVDLAFLGRKQSRGGKRSDFMWEVTQSTRALSEELREFTLRESFGQWGSYLDNRYFASTARALGRRMSPVTEPTEHLFWFAKAFEDIGREFGFTPGRTLALRACLMAWQNGRTMEIGNVFDVVYEAAGTNVDKYLHFSGGSRFDREFLIRIDDGLVDELKPQVAQNR
jgi:hypothetical protein